MKPNSNIPQIPLYFPIPLRHLWKEVYDDPMPMTMATQLYNERKGWSGKPFKIIYKL